MERILALDVGDARIGVAVSDPLGVIAQPAGLITRVGWGPDIEKIIGFADQYGTRNILCGLPLNMDGSAGGQAEKVRAFAAQLEKKGFTVAFWDERMTTVTAERALIEGGVHRADRKRLVDKTAAAVILQDYLDAKQTNQKTEEKQMEHDEERIVELTADDGSVVKFEHLMTLDHKGKSYILLTPVEPETEDEEGSVVIMRIDRDEAGEECYMIEEDEDVCDAVFDRFVEIMDEEDDEDDEEE